MAGGLARRRGHERHLHHRDPEQVEELKREIDELLARYRRVGQGNPQARRLAVYSVLYPLDLDRAPQQPAAQRNALRKRDRT